MIFEFIRNNKHNKLIKREENIKRLLNTRQIIIYTKQVGPLFQNFFNDKKALKLSVKLMNNFRLFEN